MIKDEDYRKVLDSGLSLDHYFLLCNMKSKKALITSKRIEGFINLLTKKGYIDNGALTEKALDLIENCDFSDINIEKEGKQVNLSKWISAIYKKCEDRIVELTGIKQVRSKVTLKDKFSYPFLCNERDFGKKLIRCIELYKLKDYDKIEKVLIKHIDNCHNSNTWFPLMQYYILKFDISQMVTDLGDIDDLQEEEKKINSTHKLL